MTDTNKPHPKISRAALMQGIADMKAMKPKEKDELTQKEAVEIAAETVTRLLDLGYSMAEIVGMMKTSFGLTLHTSTVRSYLRQVKVANDAAATKPATRRARKAKPVTIVMEADPIEPATCDIDPADEVTDDRDVQKDDSAHHLGGDAAGDRDGSRADGELADGDAPTDHHAPANTIDAIVAQLPPLTEDVDAADATDGADFHTPAQDMSKGRGLSDLLPPPTYRHGGGTR